MTVSTPSTLAARQERVVDALGAARAALERRAREIDDLNVFPVADGDTGANLLVTSRAVESAARASTGLPAAGRADALARAALMGARGNSGMILSQIVSGAARALAGVTTLDAHAVAAAARAASDAAERGVRVPVEGTMLTVARRIAEGAEAAVADAPAASGPALAEALDAAVASGRDGVARTTEQLAVLREAGVVDSGALGLLVLLEGLVAALTGRAPPAAPEAETGGVPITAIDHPPSRYRYCTSFLVEGAVDLARLEAELAAIGDSLLVLGDAGRAKVHLHTDAPERAGELAGRHGTVDGLEAEDMRRQEAERAARLRRQAQAGGAGAAVTAARCGAVCPVEGAGLAELFEGLGARPLPHGPGQAPGAEALAGALATLGADEAVILLADPDPAALAAAEDAAARGSGPAVVVAAGSLPAALAALVGFDPDRDAAANAEEMRELAGAVRVGTVEAEADGALRTALGATLDTLGPAALVTVLVGAGVAVAPSEIEGWIRALRPGAEVEAHEGGQSAPALVVGVE